MASGPNLPFDPDSSGAQRLLRMMRSQQRSSEPIDVVVTEPLVRFSDERGAMQSTSHRAGDHLTLSRGEGEELIAAGFVRRP